MDLAHALVTAAVTSKLAREIGAPRLAVNAARRAGELADALVIALSPVVARTSLAAEADVLADVRCTADLARLLAPDRDVDLERGGVT